VPLVHKFSIDLAGRYDNYSDFGSTSNPKVAFDWELFDGLKFRGNWATSFVAPQLIQVGDPARNHQSSSAYNLDTESFTVPTAVFPSVIGLPGCTAAMASCQINASIPGIAYQGNQVPLTPATGRTWSLGFDVGSNFLIPGFTFSATLFNNNMSNMLTSTHAAEALAAPSLNMIQFFPGGMTQAQLDAAIPAFYTQSGSIPPANQLYYVLNGNVKNFLFLDIQGVDASFNYDIPTETMGNFNVGGNVTQFTIFKQHAKFNPYKFSVLGAVGANGTFAPIPTQARFHVGWTGNQMDITLFASFMGGHHNAYGSSVVPVVNTGGRLQGGDVVKSNTVFDLHAAYTLSEDNWMGSTLAGSQFYIDIANIFDKDPVFFNTGTGYDQFSGNPLGRIVSVGFRATL
jgi:iron complex outermembrane receptor protein